MGAAKVAAPVWRRSRRSSRELEKLEDEH